MIMQNYKSTGKGENKMDDLLELLEKYPCYLKRNNQTMEEFLTANFKEYINDLKNSTKPDKNKLVGVEMCNMVEEKIQEIEENTHKLIEVFALYRTGKIIPASNAAFNIFDSMKPQLMCRYSSAYKKETYYRIRGGTDFPLERKELFHIPYTKNYLVGTERYSMPGHPCLYLASQSELCWYECRKPSQFAIAKFEIPQEANSNLKLIDFSEKLIPLKHTFFCWFHNESEEEKILIRKYLLKHIYSYPLRAACSVVVEHIGKSFIEEYIMPQMLLQWVLNDKDFDGIKYESCSSSDDVKSMGGHNLVLITNVVAGDLPHIQHLKLSLLKT